MAKAVQKQWGSLLIWFDPKTRVMSHSDQGSQFTSREWQMFLGQHNLEASMSRRGNRHDNAVAESFFQLLKRVRIRRRTYMTREAARQAVFDYIEMFYNPKRKHTNNGMLSPINFETRQEKLNEAGVRKEGAPQINLLDSLAVHGHPATANHPRRTPVASSLMNMVLFGSVD